MRPYLNPRLRNREPEPGLLGLPVALPSVPVLSPLLNPVLGGADAKPSSKPAPNPPPAPAPAPTPPPPSPAPAPAPRPNPPSGGSSGGGNNSPSSGGGSSSGGSSGNTNSGSNGGGNPQQGGNLGNNGGGNAPGAGGGSSQQNSGSDSQPSGSTPSAPAPDGPISIIGSSTFLVTSTGLVPKPENNAIANAASSPSSSDPKSDSQAASGNGESGSSASATHAAAVTSAGSQAGLVHTTVGGSNGSSGGGSVGDGTHSSNGGTAGSGASQGSHVSKGAIGGIVAALLIACMGVALVIMRNRHKRRKEERQVEWINGYVSGHEGGSQPDMLQRTNSKRSSWGTPVEYRISDAFRRSFASSGSGDNDNAYNYVVSPPSPHYNYERSATGAPVLPMPVHSPTQARAHSPEDPFADNLAQPLRRMSSLPLRISILSSVSGHEDPFDDQNTPRAMTKDPTPPSSAASNGTFGPGTGSAMFPMPPPSAGSRRETLQAPGIMISFPDSPISPSFAAAGTSSYPRRAIVQQAFSPTPSRHDEVRVEAGDEVSVVSVYEDGWAFIQRERDNERGLVPLTHLAM